MGKDAFYFSHDTNAFLDPKIRVLIAEFGLWSYGAWWVIVEMMAAQSDVRIPRRNLAASLYPLFQGKDIAYDPGDVIAEGPHGETLPATDVGCHDICLSKIESLLELMEDVGLLTGDDHFVWSESLRRRAEKRREIGAKRASAGAKGGSTKANRGGRLEHGNLLKQTPEFCLSKPEANAKQERKGKETTSLKGNSLKRESAGARDDLERSRFPLGTNTPTRPSSGIPETPGRTVEQIINGTFSALSPEKLRLLGRQR